MAAIGAQHPGGLDMETRRWYNDIAVVSANVSVVSSIPHPIGNVKSFSAASPAINWQ